MAQVEGREERCNAPTFSESFHESTVFPFSAPNAADTLAFPPDTDDLLSTHVLQGIMGFPPPTGTLSCRLAAILSTQPHTTMELHKAQISISVAALTVKTVTTLGFMWRVSGNIRSGGFSRRFLRWYHRLIARFVTPSQQKLLFSSSLVIHEPACDSKSEMSSERKSFSLCIAKRSQREGHFIIPTQPEKIEKDGDSRRVAGREEIKDKDNIL